MPGFTSRSVSAPCATRLVFVDIIRTQNKKNKIPSLVVKSCSVWSNQNYENILPLLLYSQTGYFVHSSNSQEWPKIWNKDWGAMNSFWKTYDIYAGLLVLYWYTTTQPTLSCLPHPPPICGIDYNIHQGWVLCSYTFIRLIHPFRRIKYSFKI